MGKSWDEMMDDYCSNNKKVNPTWDMMPGYGEEIKKKEDKDVVIAVTETPVAPVTPEPVEFISNYSLTNNNTVENQEVINNDNTINEEPVAEEKVTETNVKNVTVKKAVIENTNTDEVNVEKTVDIKEAMENVKEALPESFKDAVAKMTNNSNKVNEKKPETPVTNNVIHTETKKPGRPAKK